MRLVVADTGPLNYLLLIEAIDILPKLFETILVPAAVHDELAHADAPAVANIIGAAIPILETTYHCDSVRTQRGRFASLR